MVEKTIGVDELLVPAGERPTNGLSHPDVPANPRHVSETEPPTPFGVPILFVSGARDQLVTPEETAALAKEQGPAGRSVNFPNSAEFPMVEEHDKFIELMERFVLPKR